MRRPRPLEDADRKHHAEFPRQGAEAQNSRMPVQLMGAGEEADMLLDAEVIGIEEFLQQHEARTLCCGLAHQGFGLVAVLRPALGRRPSG